MRVRVAELEFTASVAEVADRALTIQFRAPKPEMHEQLLQAAANPRARVQSLEDEREWRIADVSFGYVGSEPWGMHHHTWRLALVDRTAAGVVVVAGVELEPYELRVEPTDDGVARLMLRAAVTDAQLAELAPLSGTVVTVQHERGEQRMLLERFAWGPSSAHGQAVALVCTDLLAFRRVADIDAWEL